MLKKLSYSLYVVLCGYCLYQWGFSLLALFILAFLGTALYTCTMLFYQGSNSFEFELLQQIISLTWIVWGVWFLIFNYVENGNILIPSFVVIFFAVGGMFWMQMLDPVPPKGNYGPPWNSD